MATSWYKQDAECSNVPQEEIVSLGQSFTCETLPYSKSNVVHNNRLRLLLHRYNQ